MTSGSGNYHTHALTRGLRVLELFSGRTPPLTLTDIHDASGLPKSTLVRLLSALAEAEFVMKVDDRPAYRLGHKVMELADSYVSSLDITQVAGDYLDSLSRQTRQTSNIGLLDGDQILHVCVRLPDRPLRFEQSIGARSHNHCTGLGKVLLADLSPEQVSAHVMAEPYQKLTERTISRRAELDSELRRIRRKGFALDDNEHNVGLRCLAISLRHDGETLAALSVSGPSGEFGPEDQRRYLDALQDAAEQLVADPEVVAALRRIYSTLRRSQVAEPA
ncbi:IclR family transcriptional regulator [Flindersiella endophytica]